MLCSGNFNKYRIKNSNIYSSSRGLVAVVVILCLVVLCLVFMILSLTMMDDAKDITQNTKIIQRTQSNPVDVPYCNVNGSYMQLKGKGDELLQITVFIRHGTRTHFDGENKQCARNSYFSPTAQNAYTSNYYPKDNSPCLREKAVRQIQHAATQIYMSFAKDATFSDKFARFQNRTRFFTTNTSRTRDTIDIFGETIMKNNVKYPISFFPDHEDPLRPFETTCNFDKFLKWEKKEYNKSKHERFEYSQYTTDDAELVFEYLRAQGKTNSTLDGWLRMYQKSVSEFCNRDREFGIEELRTIQKLYPVFAATMSNIYKKISAFELSKQVIHRAISMLATQVENAVKGGDDYWLMSVFGTHDYTIAYLLSSLKFYHWSWPIYADTVTIRTFRRQSNSIYIQVDQNGLLVGRLELEEFRERVKFEKEFEGKPCPV